MSSEAFFPSFSYLSAARSTWSHYAQERSFMAQFNPNIAPLPLRCIFAPSKIFVVFLSPFYFRRSSPHLNSPYSPLLIFVMARFFKGTITKSQMHQTCKWTSPFDIDAQCSLIVCIYKYFLSLVLTFSLHAYDSLPTAWIGIPHIAPRCSIFWAKCGPSYTRHNNLRDTFSGFSLLVFPRWIGFLGPRCSTHSPAIQFPWYSSILFGMQSVCIWIQQYTLKFPFPFLHIPIFFWIVRRIILRWSLPALRISQTWTITAIRSRDEPSSVSAKPLSLSGSNAVQRFRSFALRYV